MEVGRLDSRVNATTAPRGRYNKTKPGGVMTWMEIKADAWVLRRVLSFCHHHFSEND
jgi:hypothetical protein